jgi:PAS domain S-box-containing protein
MLHEIFGVKAGAFKGTYEDFLARVHPEDRADLMKVIETAFRTGGDFRMDERILRPGGEIRHLQGSGRAVTDKHGITVRLLGVYQDVTDRRRAEAALADAQQTRHQAQKMEALGQLTGGIAHDFNNILTAITNSIELVRETGALEPDQTARLERALQAARNGAALVQQLLVFARRQPGQSEPRDVNAILRATMTMFAHSASENIAVATELAPDLCFARVDATQLQTAILNLAVNARDAMPGGGTLRVASANVRPEDGRPAAACVAITISDTGIGMPPEVLARAFEPFFTTKEIGKGTGLGLSMVYSAIRQMGGEVTMTSEPGKGTTVRLLLPALDPPASHAADTPAPTPERIAEPVKILYVEDEPLVRLATIDLLTSAGYSVSEAPDAERALTLLEGDSEIGVMVTDVGLPGMNGHELAAEARRRRPGLKVVFLTGYDRDSATETLRRDPAIRYLDKPYQPGDLFRALAELSAIHAPR